MTLPLPSALSTPMDEQEARRFNAWLSTLRASPDTLGGEPTFPNSRLSVRHVGGMIRNGVPLSEILEDYPYLTEDDLDFSAKF